MLGATSAVLSVASGWTTWDGMRNFTDGNILSLLITFGIQGVLLVLAWFIGARLAEGFAFGGQGDGARSESRGVTRLMRFFEAVIVAGLVLLLINLFAVNFTELPPAFVAGIREYAVNDILIWGALALLVVLVVMRSGRAFVGGSVLTAQIMVRQAIPFAMLATCMFASVFFSFDSLFSNILPDDERRRIADLRSKTETAGIISEISDTTTQTYLSEVQSLLSGPAWQAYKDRLDDLTKRLGQLPGEAQTFLSEQERSRLTQSSQRQSERLKLENERRAVDQPPTADRGRPRAEAGSLEGDPGRDRRTHQANRRAGTRHRRQAGRDGRRREGHRRDRQGRPRPRNTVSSPASTIVSRHRRKTSNSGAPVFASSLRTTRRGSRSSPAHS